MYIWLKLGILRDILSVFYGNLIYQQVLKAPSAFSSPGYLLFKMLEKSELVEETVDVLG